MTLKEKSPSHSASITPISEAAKSSLPSSVLPFSCPSIHLKNLTAAYKTTLALKGVSGTFKSNSFTAIVGPNGGGKSTLLKTLAGMMKPYSGSIDTQGLRPEDIAYLPQQAQIDRTFPMTVRDAVSFGLCQKKGFFSRLTPYVKDQISGALEEVGMLDCAKRSLDALSGGQFQRVLLARLAVQQASMILLDEPFAAIDRYTIEDLLELLHRWHAQGRTIVVVSHDLDLVKEHFPEALLLARQCLGWGKTSDIVTLDLLREAKKLSREWESCVNLPQDGLETL